MFNQLFLNGIIAGSIYALIALGFTVIYKTVRFFHFAHMELMSLWVKELNWINMDIQLQDISTRASCSHEGEE
ncbi:MAG: hypothetical protein Q8P40_09035 [Nitrospirota bacterium]|nr:hypothetical protein [Nitrospirota bacterium]